MPRSTILVGGSSDSPPRAYNYPELRGIAREMWDHLRRGEAHLDTELIPYEPDELLPYSDWAIG